MKQKLFYFILVVILTTFVSCDPVTYDTFGSISGTIVDKSTSDPIKGAFITIAPKLKHTYTGSDGSFEIQNVEPDQYTLTIQADGYETDYCKVTVVAGAFERVFVALNPLNPND